MTEAIIVAVITAAATITAQLIINAGNRARQEAIASAQQAVIIQRVTELEKKVDKHNCLVERMALAEASIKSAHKRLDDMRHARECAEKALEFSPGDERIKNNLTFMREDKQK